MRRISLPNRALGPEQPVSLKVNSTEVTLKVIDKGEYKFGDNLWQDEPYCAGLTPNTTYTVVQRYKAVEGVAFASHESQSPILTMGPLPIEEKDNKSAEKIGRLPNTGGKGFAIFCVIGFLGGSLLIRQGRREN